METLVNSSRVINTSMICVIISGPSLNEAREQVYRSGSRADLLEFRLDQFSFCNIEAIAHLKNASAVPVIFTLRKRSHGGEYAGDEQQRMDQIRRLIALKPAYFDLEYDVSKTFYDEMYKLYSDVEIICSFHDFEQTPKDLQAIFEAIKQRPASIYKIATMANSTLDSMRILKFMLENVKKGFRISAICMGEYGSVSRILGVVFGNSIVYAPLTSDLSTAPGQLPLDELLNRYHLKKHTKETIVLGLIGDPVNKSPSHQTHNQVLKALKLKAVYVKFNIQQPELHEFLEFAKKLNIKGLSVTMPLKELAVCGLSEKSEDSVNIEAINTLIIENRKINGINTDGIGALDALEEHEKVNGKTIVILGAGGAAKAIAWEAHKRGANIVILNRTIEKAEELAKATEGSFGSLLDFPVIASKGYDILINATSVGLVSEKSRLPIDSSFMLEGKIVLDVIPSSTDTPFLYEAKNKNCRIVFGNKMLMYQAIEQFNFWFGDTINKLQIKEAFFEAFKTI